MTSTMSSFNALGFSKHRTPKGFPPAPRLRSGQDKLPFNWPVCGSTMAIRAWSRSATSKRSDALCQQRLCGFRKSEVGCGGEIHSIASGRPEVAPQRSTRFASPPSPSEKYTLDPRNAASATLPKAALPLPLAFPRSWPSSEKDMTRWPKKSITHTFSSARPAAASAGCTTNPWPPQEPFEIPTSAAPKAERNLPDLSSTNTGCG
mmetsp:Transcript_112210/g.281189  ORF Transcript_112210/g.281189 Transcript_112210/m.281189 type:complete len:205 (+) Transcript_112210:275-889(+)